MPNYTPDNEEQANYLWCVRNNIRVSPGGVKGQPGCWTIDISTDGKTWKSSPESYEKDTIWPKYYEICKWFVDKYKNK